jgi:diguanylate cyclase (GGDEF)-like protein/PAS domain S-box-containing protein
MQIKESLLVVDDEEMNRNLLSRRLERSGFRVEVASGGAEALTKIAGQAQFDLILLDQMMPEKSGSDVLRELRAHYSASDLPVIMVTAVTDSGRVAEALDLGANDYITKPVDFTIALARIRAQLSRKHAETARRVSEERYELAARAANDGLWDWDLIGNRVYYSERWKGMMGLSDAEVGHSPEEWFSRVHSEDLVHLREALQQHLDGKSLAFEADYRIRRRDGHYRWMVGRGMALRGPDGHPSRMAGSQSDITDKKTVDVLTGLPNRLLFEERLTAAIERARVDAAYRFAAYFIDLDRFKLVNDTLGHAAGDQLLIQFAERLRTWGNRQAVVARLGGDEFAVLLDSISGPGDAIAQGDRLIRAIRPAFRLEGQEFFSTASVGIVTFQPEHTTAADLIRDADIAMYVAKSRGRGRWVVFDESMRRRAFERMQIETDLRMALPKGQLVLYYQSRVDLNTNQIRGFEALLRWIHPQRGLIPPDDFIRIAEETGVIRDIGLWVLGEACAQMRIWRERYPDQPWLDVAVNVSPVQLRDPALVQQIAGILAESGLEPSALQIEITESTLLDNLDEARTILSALKDLGVGLKLDDFATGYSCLRYLYRLPFDSIKIDRSFTMELDDGNPESRELVRTILSMAQNLGLGVIAEGVENRISADFLRDQGCRFGQGFFFSPPVTAHDVEKLLSGTLPHNSETQDDSE